MIEEIFASMQLQAGRFEVDAIVRWSYGFEQKQS